MQKIFRHGGDDGFFKITKLMIKGKTVAATVAVPRHHGDENDELVSIVGWFFCCF